MTWRLPKLTIIYMIPALISAIIVWYWLTSTNPTNVIDQANTPFVTINVLPETLQEGFIDNPPSGSWTLSYTLKLTDRISACQSLFIHKTIFGIDKSEPIASNGLVALPIYPATTDTQTLILKNMLVPGYYILTVEIQCFQEDRNDSKLSTVLRPPAQASPTCFQITGGEFVEHPHWPARLKSINCALLLAIPATDKRP
jgi:hypothetical protein